MILALKFTDILLQLCFVCINGFYIFVNDDIISLHSLSFKVLYVTSQKAWVPLPECNQQNTFGTQNIFDSYLTPIPKCNALLSSIFLFGIFRVLIFKILIINTRIMLNLISKVRSVKRSNDSQFYTKLYRIKIVVFKRKVCCYIKGKYLGNRENTKGF